MKKNNYIMFIISILLIFSIVGCTINKDTESVLSSTVSEDLKNDELDIMELLQRGDDSLKSQDFVATKDFFEKAIMKDKMNISTYLSIKDKFLEVQRLDDAYYFVNLAIDNGVDKDNMTKILDEIKSKFTPITLSSTIVKSSAFGLPTTVDVSVNNTDTETCDVTWETAPNTNKVGSFTYNGYCNQYNRTVTYNLTVREPIKSHKIGFLTDIHDDNVSMSLKFDEIEFYTTEDATREFLKDNTTVSDIQTPYNDYYIRNNSKEAITYTLSPNCSFNLCAYLISNLNDDSSALKSVDANYFKNYVIDSNKQYNAYEHKDTNGNRGVLVWIDTEEGLIINIEMQFTP